MYNLAIVCETVHARVVVSLEAVHIAELHDDAEGCDMWWLNSAKQSGWVLGTKCC